MKRYAREVLTGLLITFLLIAGIAYFYQHMQTRKRTEQIDLYALIAPDPQVVISLNRPQVVASLILSHAEIEAAFRASLPEVFFSLIQETPATSASLLSVHPHGVLFYTKVEGKGMKRFEKEVLRKHFPAYPPAIEKKDGISRYFFPDTAHRFFGYYHHEGILVAGYNLKLLEEVVEKQKYNNQKRDNVFLTGNYTYDTHAPMNVFLSAEAFALHFPVNDSITWQAQKQWLTADVFTNEGRVCYYSTLEVSEPLDSCYLQLAADTLTHQIRQFFPTLQIDAQISQEEQRIHYTGCTTKPS